MTLFQSHAQKSELHLMTGLYNNPLEIKDSINLPYRLITKVSLLDPVYGIILVGVEKPFTKNESAELAIGYIFNDFFNNYKDPVEVTVNPISRKFDNSKVNLSVRLENKFFLKKQKLNNQRWYMAPELFFNIRNYKSNHHPCVQVTTGWYTPFVCSGYTENRYTTIRRDFGIHLKGGFQKIYKSRLTIDFFSGLGFRKISTSTKGKINSQIEPGGGLFSYPGKPAEEFDEIDKVKLSANIGVRIGFAFK